MSQVSDIFSFFSTINGIKFIDCIAMGLRWHKYTDYNHLNKSIQSFVDSR